MSASSPATAKEAPTRRRRVGRAARLVSRGAATAALLVGTVLAGAMLVPSLIGFERYVITGASLVDILVRWSPSSPGPLPPG